MAATTIGSETYWIKETAGSNRYETRVNRLTKITIKIPTIKALVYRLFKIYLKNQDFEKSVWFFVDGVSSGLILSFMTSPPVMHTSIIANISSYICA